MGYCQRILILLLAVAATVPVIIKSRPSAETTARAVLSVPSAVQGYVQIRGDVRHPGIYPLTANKLTLDAILLAEPARSILRIEPSMTEAIPVVNGESLHVSIRTDGTAVVTRGSIAAAQRLVLGIPLDINAVSESDLDKVPGIGPAMAHRIVMYRQKNGGNMSVKELLQVEGIGEKKYSALQKYF